MMKRLTEYVNFLGGALPVVKNGPIYRAVDRLASIEDILGDEYLLGRLEELMEADKQGRIKILDGHPDPVGPTGPPNDLEDSEITAGNDLNMV